MIDLQLQTLEAQWRFTHLISSHLISSMFFKHEHWLIFP